MVKKFIRIGRRIIPIKDSKFAKSASKASFDKMTTDNFAKRSLSKGMSETEKSALSSMAKKSSTRLDKINKLRKKNSDYSKKFKIAGASATGALAGLAGVLSAKRRKDNKK